MRTKLLFSAMAFSACVSGSAFAQVNTCEPRGTNGMVTVVLCQEGLDATTWQMAGEAACGDRKPCGAWIWDDEANLPIDIPDAHDKLPADSIRSALAVWMNEQDQLIVLEKLE